ncbi:ATP-binding protein [bacterium]|nr:ATP-binding protein [bacterium]
MKKKGLIIYIYVGLFLSAILIILIGNSYFLIDRTRSNLIEIYWKQGELIVKSIAVSVQQSIESIKLTPQQIRRHLKKTALIIDKEYSNSQGMTEEELTNFLIDHDLQSVSIFDESGFLLISATNTFVTLPTQLFEVDQAETAQIDLLPMTMEFDRNEKQGKLFFTLSPEKLLAIKTNIGLQLLIASLENQNIIQFISFIDDHFRIVADSDPNRIGIVEEEIEYLDAIKSGVSYFFRDSNENTMKVIHPVSFTPNNRGILKVGYPITRIDKIYENAFKNAVINSSVVMFLAIIAAFIAVKLNRRNLEKIEFMEKRIRENEKLASLANLTAGVAHEVRNPLNSVSITIQRLQLEFKPQDDNDIEEYNTLTELMKREVDRISLIISDFLDFAKPFEPKKTEFNIAEFIKKGIAIIRAEGDSRGVNIITNLSATNQSFFGDYEKLTQVLINLIRNALEASERYDTITIDSMVNEDSGWVLQIKDNGAGISKENLNHIFDIYFTTKKNGTGLGLYICQKIIKAHDGSIELQPNMAKGITVSIKLPFLDY